MIAGEQGDIQVLEEDNDAPSPIPEIDHLITFTPSLTNEVKAFLGVGPGAEEDQAFYEDEAAFARRTLVNNFVSMAILLFDRPKSDPEGVGLTNEMMPDLSCLPDEAERASMSEAITDGRRFLQRDLALGDEQIGKAYRALHDTLLAAADAPIGLSHGMELIRRGTNGLAVRQTTPVPA